MYNILNVKLFIFVHLFNIGESKIFEDNICPDLVCTYSLHLMLHVLALVYTVRILRTCTRTWNQVRNDWGLYSYTWSCFPLQNLLLQKRYFASFLPFFHFVSLFHSSNRFPICFPLDIVHPQCVPCRCCSCEEHHSCRFLQRKRKTTAQIHGCFVGGMVCKRQLPSSSSS